MMPAAVLFPMPQGRAPAAAWQRASIRRIRRDAHEG